MINVIAVSREELWRVLEGHLHCLKLIDMIQVIIQFLYLGYNIANQLLCCLHNKAYLYIKLS